MPDAAGERFDLVRRARVEQVPKRLTRGTHRAVALAATVDRAQQLAAGAGITRVANVTGLDTIGIPVVMVVRPNSRMLAVSQGKGLDLAAARASGLMEALEGHRAESVTGPLRLDRYRTLASARRVLSVDRLPRAPGSPFDPDLPILWHEALDLVADAPTWVPFEMVSADYTVPRPAGSGCFPANTNGLASGNHLLEAASYALCELIERDATALEAVRSAGEREAARVDLDTVDDPDCVELIERYAAARIQVAVWEMTTDIGVAAFHCRIVDREPNPHHPAYPADGMGCHMRRGIALARALTEAAQSRLTEITGSRDDLMRAAHERLMGTELHQQHLEALATERPTRDFSGAPDVEHEDFAAEVEALLEQLRRVAIDEVAVVPLSLGPDDVPVVRVIVPGLEGMGYRHDGRTAYLPGERARARLELRARDGATAPSADAGRVARDRR